MRAVPAAVMLASTCSADTDSACRRRRFLNIGADRNQVIRPLDLRPVPSKVEEADASRAQLAAEGCERLLHLLAGGIQEQGDFEAERLQRGRHVRSIIDRIR